MTVNNGCRISTCCCTGDAKTPAAAFRSISASSICRYGSPYAMRRRTSTGFVSWWQKPDATAPDLLLTQGTTATVEAVGTLDRRSTRSDIITDLPVLFADRFTRPR